MVRCPPTLSVSLAYIDFILWHCFFPLLIDKDIQTGRNPDAYNNQQDNTYPTFDGLIQVTVLPPTILGRCPLASVCCLVSCVQGLDSTLQGSIGNALDQGR